MLQLSQVAGRVSKPDVCTHCNKGVRLTPHKLLQHHRQLISIAARRKDGKAKHTAPTLSAVSTELDAPSDSPIMMAQTTDKRQQIMQETRDFLRTDLQRLFNSGEITTSRYSRDIRFEDPISKYDSLDGYLLNIRALRTFFHIKFDLHTIDVSAPEEITARWTMSMEFWLLPWKPTLLFTGRTFYTVNPDNGLVLSHTDVWDAVSNNRFLSLEALQHVLRMFLEVQLTPSLETPRYSVLRKTRDYEIRQYESYVVAETDMPRGSGPAAGTGFTDLAGYIFGGNQENARMEMTTPVFTTADPSAGSTSTSNIKMQFVMEERFRDPQLLPSPKDGRILTKKEDGGYFAVVRFSGWPLDFEVVRNERQLREALHRDGHKPRKGYRLARYNEPYVPPFVRRNEVLIELDEFVWP